MPRLIGTFASVLAVARSGSRPISRVASIAALTSGSDGVGLAARAIADHRDGERERRRAARAAEILLVQRGVRRCADLALVGAQRVLRRGAKIDLEPRIIRDRVHRDAAADASHRERRARMRGERGAREHRARERRGVHRIRDAERGPAVPTRAAKVKAETTRAERAVDDALVAGAVERDRRGRAAHRAREQLLRAAQVARALLARGRGENDRRARAKLRAVDHAGEREHRREAAPVVADAGSDQARAVALHAQRHRARKYRVQMRADDNGRGVVRAGTRARDVAGGIGAHARERECAEARRDPFAALTLFAGGSRDLGYRDLRVERFGISCGECCARICDWGRVPQRAKTGGESHPS